MARILIVEDDENLLELLCDWLGSQKYQVDTASTGLEAVEQLRFQQYDAVLMDRHLPEMDGLEIVTELRSAGNLTPVIMLTGSDDKKQQQEGMAAGVNAYMSKPFQLHELASCIKSLVAEKT